MPRLIFKQPGGLPECPYFHRWALQFKNWSIRLHWWHADDDHRAFHDHPHSFLTIVLWGGYTDRVMFKSGTTREEVLRVGSIRWRSYKHRHQVIDVIPGSWTLLFTGPSTHRWGFWTNAHKRYSRDTYFAVKGHHACDPMDEPVRQRPDGSRIESKTGEHTYE